MESHNSENNEELVEMGMGGSSGSSRWNPTKEQISMLENLYKQGIRTPSAEEIQHITSRLRVYGHIEGKNVFYWFQNHKARQRQKQKQETLAYFNRFLNRPQPIFSPTPIYPNVLCTPYCIPQVTQGEIGFYPTQHSSKVLLPALGIRKSPSEKLMMPPMGMSSICNDRMVYEGMQQQRISDYNNYNNNNLNSCYSNVSSNQETLDLFPLHPTGILDGKTVTTTTTQNVPLVSADSSTDTPTFASSDDLVYEHEVTTTPFFDFFSSGQGSQHR